MGVWERGPSRVWGTARQPSQRGSLSIHTYGVLTSRRARGVIAGPPGLTGDGPAPAARSGLGGGSHECLL